MHLHPQVSSIIEDVKRRSINLLFLDYDGTLVGLKMNPEDAVASEDLLSTLRKLAGKFQIYIVTGRALADLRGFLNDEFDVVALHGAVSYINHKISFNVESFQKYREICNDIYSRKDEYISMFPGLRIYNKDGNLLFHFGLMSDKQHEELFHIVENLSKTTGMPVYKGKLIIELRIPGINKGIAIEKIRAGRDCMIAGDDTTDEEAFLENPDTLTVHVGGGESTSRYRLKDPDEMLLLLKSLCELELPI